MHELDATEWTEKRSHSSKKTVYEMVVDCIVAIARAVLSRTGTNARPSCIAVPMKPQQRDAAGRCRRHDQ